MNASCSGTNSSVTLLVRQCKTTQRKKDSGKSCPQTTSHAQIESLEAVNTAPEFVRAGGSKWQ